MTLPIAFVPMYALSLAAQPAAAAHPALPWLGGAVLGALSASVVASRRVAQVRGALAKAKSAHHAALNDHAKRAVDQGQTAQSSKKALRETEIALAAQKKKNFKQQALLQEALDAAQEAQIRANEAVAAAQHARRQADAQRHAEAARQAGPASKAKRAQAPIEPPAEPESAAQAPTEAQAIQTAPPQDAAPAAMPQSEAEKALQAHLEQLSQALSAAQEACAQSEALRTDQAKKLKEVRREQARKDKRIEDLRRVDLMSRGKIGVLEDKLKRMGRDLYETISALAQARGEVRPIPAPKAQNAQPKSNGIHGPQAPRSDAARPS